MQKNELKQSSDRLSSPAIRRGFFPLLHLKYYAVVSSFIGCGTCTVYMHVMYASMARVQFIPFFPLLSSIFSSSSNIAVCTVVVICYHYFVVSLFRGISFRKVYI